MIFCSSSTSGRPRVITSSMAGFSSHQGWTWMWASVAGTGAEDNTRPVCASLSVAMSPAFALALLLLPPEGRPLFYWGARPAVIAATPVPSGGTEAHVTEVHVALEQNDLFVRFTFDRSVRDVLYSQEGQPISGRLRAPLCVAADGRAVSTRGRATCVRAPRRGSTWESWRWARTRRRSWRRARS